MDKPHSKQKKIDDMPHLVIIYGNLLSGILLLVTFLNLKKLKEKEIILSVVLLSIVTVLNMFISNISTLYISMQAKIIAGLIYVFFSPTIVLLIERLWNVKMDKKHID